METAVVHKLNSTAAHTDCPSKTKSIPKAGTARQTNPKIGNIKMAAIPNARLPMMNFSHKEMFGAVFVVLNLEDDIGLAVLTFQPPAHQNPI